MSRWTRGRLLQDHVQEMAADHPHWISFHKGPSASTLTVQNTCALAIKGEGCASNQGGGAIILEGGWGKIDPYAAPWRGWHAKGAPCRESPFRVADGPAGGEHERHMHDLTDAAPRQQLCILFRYAWSEW